MIDVYSMKLSKNKQKVKKRMDEMVCKSVELHVQYYVMYDLNLGEGSMR